MLFSYCFLTEEREGKQKTKPGTGITGNHKEDGFPCFRSLLHSQRIIDALINNIVQEQYLAGSFTTDNSGRNPVFTSDVIILVIISFANSITGPIAA